MTAQHLTEPGLIVYGTLPYNAEPALARLRRAFITDQGSFYVRSHGNIPVLDPATHVVEVTGIVARPQRFTVAELLARFPSRTVPAVLQCAGNRRAELHALQPVSGDAWQGGAIGNATWTGVPLARLLEAAGAPDDPGLHVAFDACDECLRQEGSFHYGASIPIGKARAPEVLLAAKMNGAALRPEHGFPLRALVPGWAGVRSVKWIRRIEVRDRPSENPMQARDYKLFPPEVTAATVDWERGFTINEMPLNAMICTPAAGASLPAGRTIVRGYAVASGRAVVRVDLSRDGGRSWIQATLDGRHDAPWCWAFWQAELELPPGSHELVVRAWDQAGQTQPADIASCWNFKGYLCAAWHRIEVTAA